MSDYGANEPLTKWWFHLLGNDNRRHQIKRPMHKDYESYVNIQKKIASQFKTPYVATDQDMIIGLSDTVKSGLNPINGLRHPIEAGVSGWYIWAGKELSQADDFFKPVHLSHVYNLFPEAVPYLALGPGWRFLIDGDYVDVWYEKSLLEV